MHLTPRELDKLAPPRRRLPRAEAPRARPAPQLPGGGRAHRDAAARAHSRRPLGRRADGPRPAACSAARQVHGRRARDDRRGAGRGHVPRRHEARDGAPPDRRSSSGDLALALYGSFLPVPAARRASPAGPPRRRAARARSLVAPGDDRAQRRARDVVELDGHEPRRPADPGRQPLSLSPRPTARSTFDRARARTACASTSRPARRCASSPARRRPSRLVAGRRGAARSDAAEVRRERTASTRAHYADMFGPTTGDRVRLGDTGLVAEVERDFTVVRRRVQVRRRQGPARRHGPGAPASATPTRSTASSPTRSSSTGPASTRPTSASRTAASPASARPATPT